MKSALHITATKAFSDTDAHKRSAFALITAQSGKALLLRKNDVNSAEHGKFEMPGGGVDCNESFYQGVIRETCEETGFQISSAVPVTNINHNGRQGLTELMIFVAATQDEFEPEFTHNPITGHLEHSEYRWFTLDEILSSEEIHTKQKKDILNNHEYIRDAIHQCVSMHGTRQCLDNG